MIRLLEDRRPELAQLCAHYRVGRLEVFGSARTGERFDETSDLDFLIEFLPLRQGERADAYFGLLEAMEDLFQRPVDLVVRQAIRNPFFLEAVNNERELLYAP
jgi:predicted nucleotidyltransferase